MSLVGFKGQNHPQQTKKRGAKPEVDNLETPWEFFEPLNERFGGFDLDVATLPHSAKCGAYYTPKDDGLAQTWFGRVWCNPPYSQIGLWVDRAWRAWESDPVNLIVMLLPANRTEQKWWQENVEPRRDRPDSPLRVEFLSGRLRFIKHGHDRVEPNQRPPFGCCLLIWGDT